PGPKRRGPVLLAWGASLVVMVSQKDLGSSLLFFTLFLVLLWVATERISYLAVGVLLFAGGAVIAFNIFDHVQKRVDLWGGFWSLISPPGSPAEQIDTAAFHMADGGIAGTGLGLGSPADIPIVESDFIYAAIVEELGLIGATGVLIG